MPTTTGYALCPTLIEKAIGVTDAPVNVLRFVKQGRELAAMMQASAVSPTKPKLIDSKLCQCSCGQTHNNAVSKLAGDHTNRRILWFRSGMCRAKWEKANG